MAAASVDNHFVATIVPSLGRYADRVVFRPYLGSNDEWGSVTYRELQQQLSVAQTHWRAVLSPFNLKRFDVVGFWYASSKALSRLVSLTTHIATQADRAEARRHRQYALSIISGIHPTVLRLLLYPLPGHS